MAQLIEYQLEDGGKAYAAVDRVGGGVVPVAAPGDIAVQAQQTFEQALGQVRPTVDTFVRQFRDMADQPSEARLEFELGLDIEAGAFFAKLGGGANFKVALTWSRSED